MSKETGGPAFPYSGVHHTEAMNYIIDSHGMTLRDYFAGLAMQAICKVSSGHLPESGSEQAYSWADAMLKERTKAEGDSIEVWKKLSEQ